MKGMELSNDIVVRFGSILSEKYIESNVLISAQKVEVIKRGIAWSL